MLLFLFIFSVFTGGLKGAKRQLIIATLAPSLTSFPNKCNPIKPPAHVTITFFIYISSNYQFLNNEIFGSTHLSMPHDYIFFWHELRHFRKIFYISHHLSITLLLY